MSQRIIVTGAGGRLGAALVRHWNALGEDVLGLTRADLDISSPDEIQSVLGSQTFGVLVNCAAQTDVDRCERDPEEAMRINAQAPCDLAEVCAANRARCIHISTDYVFDGESSAPYTEEDAAEPISQYGASKLAGELSVLGASDRNLIARVSWVFGPDRPSFIDQILKKARTESTVAAVADKFAVPSYTADVARFLRPFLFEQQLSGILHVCNSGDCSWQEYAQHALDSAAAAGDELKATFVEPLLMADLKAFIARRPRYSVLSTSKLTNLMGYPPRSWRDAVREYVEQFR